MGGVGSLPMVVREGGLKLPRVIKMRRQQVLGVVYLDISVFFPSVWGLCPRWFGRGGRGGNCRAGVEIAGNINTIRG